MSKQQFPAALRIDNPVSTISGADDSVQAINTHELPDGSVVLCNATHSFYELRKADGATADGSNIVAPTAGPGRWYDMGRGASFVQSVNLPYSAMPPNSGAYTSEVVVNGVVDGDVIAVVVRDTSVPSNLVVGLPYVSSAGHATWHLYNVGGATIAGGTVNLRVAVLPA